MNWKGFERKRSSSNSRATPEFSRRYYEKTMKSVSQDSLCPFRDSNRIPSELKSIALPPDQSIWSEPEEKTATDGKIILRKQNDVHWIKTSENRLDWQGSFGHSNGPLRSTRSRNLLTVYRVSASDEGPYSKEFVIFHTSILKKSTL
jgi:hypothetical protein